MSMGPNSFNGIGVLIGGAAASVAAVPVLAGLGLSWAVNKARPRSFRPFLVLAGGNLALLVAAVAVMDQFNLIGPRIPAWVDYLGLVWFILFAALSVLLLLAYSRKAATP
jgi:hypothetical protein